MRRGRPRHNDVLTPREWEVLNLLRRGLTNEQIAAELDVSLSTTKYHVASIMMKLGVENRREAAAWQGRPKVASGFAPLAWLRAKLGGASPLRTAGAVAIAGGVVAMAVLMAGVVLMGARSRTEEPEANLEGRTGDEALDAVLDSLLQDSATALAARFAGVTAREGVLEDGSAGLVESRTVGSDEWTQRLGDSDRTLYAVVSDASEPYDWYQASPPPMPRAAVFAGQRDYDILLVVNEREGDRTPWRFSLEGGRIIDVVVAHAPAPPDLLPGSLPPGAYWRRPSDLLPIVRFTELMPSPADEPQRFAILPPEDQWPAPVAKAPPGSPRPAGVAEPSFAPDGRTGDAATDRLIELLLTGGAADVARAAGQLRANSDQCVGIIPPNDCRLERISVPPTVWIDQFVPAARSLYAVTTGDPSGIDVYMAVDTGAEAREAWIFGVEGGRITQLSIHRVPARGWVRNDSWTGPSFLHVIHSFTPSPRDEYQRFFVLPPVEMKPDPPSGLGLSVRTGNAQVDGIIALIEARDVAGFSAAIDSNNGLLVRSCRQADQRWDNAAVRQWAAETLPRTDRLNSVVLVPDGYRPNAEHMIIVITQFTPYRWELVGILEGQGRVQGLLLSEDLCGLPVMHPPAGYFVAPPPQDLGGLDPARRSGIAMIDAVLEAAYAGDTAALEGLIAIRPVGCGGGDYALRCPDGASTGTQVDGIFLTACRGGNTRTGGWTLTQLVDSISSASLYAVATPNLRPDQPIGPGTEPFPPYEVIMAGGASGPFALLFDDVGLSAVAHGCGAFHPNWAVPGSPVFLRVPE